MRLVCWRASPAYFGKGLTYIYEKRFGSVPQFPETYEGNNHCDCFMTLALYKIWRKGQLAAPNRERKAHQGSFL